MKNLILLFLTIFIISCNEKNNQAEIKSMDENKIDYQAELASIEETRAGFQLAIKEKRYADLRNFSTREIISLTPICGT
tara:strand:+ start:379 stop:615 length:237 start_codon:yes stop_codon:yes gene_type:complete